MAQAQDEEKLDVVTTFDRNAFLNETRRRDLIREINTSQERLLEKLKNRKSCEELEDFVFSLTTGCTL